MIKIPTVELNTGASMPAIGFGTWQLAEGEEVEGAVTAALNCGYRLIDTAKIYGNETGVGVAVGGSYVPRAEVFVTTKLWDSDHGNKAAHRAFSDSLKRLSMKYVDLYLIHWPATELRHEAWQALTEIYHSGQARAVGVSNYMVKHLKELLSRSELMPAVNQIEFHPFIYEQQVPVVEFCQERGIVVQAYSPLARAHGLDNPIIDNIAKSHGKTDAQIMLRWAVQHGTVPIPKSSHTERIKENIDIFDFELTGKEMDSLNSLSNGESAL